MSFLVNAPNIEKNGIILDMGRRATNDDIMINGDLCRVSMHFVLHRCGTPIHAAMDKAEYRRWNNRPKYSPSGERNYRALRIKRLYCPQCRIRVGKTDRRRLEKFGKLFNFTANTGVVEGEIEKSVEVVASYIFPRGLELSFDCTEIIGYDPEYVRNLWELPA